jgi:hypothetical protein
MCAATVAVVDQDHQAARETKRRTRRGRAGTAAAAGSECGCHEKAGTSTPTPGGGG